VNFNSWRQFIDRLPTFIVHSKTTSPIFTPAWFTIIMAKLRQIAQLGAPILRQQAKDVTTINSLATQSIIADMLATLSESNGVGLAAPQIYEPWRIIIIASRPTPRYPHAPEMEATIMINPSFHALSEAKEKDWEGCLSIPGIRAQVPRYKQIAVDYTNLQSETVKQHYDGFVARVFQHEYDHLNGRVYLDRVENSRDIISEKEFFKQITGQ
jgi:peptide deformylase